MENGIFEFKVGEKTVGLRFGTRALRILEKKMKLDISVILTIASEGKTGIDFMCDIFECAALDYCHTKKVEVDFTNEDMPDWVDAIGGLNAGLKVLADGLTHYHPKN